MDRLNRAESVVFGTSEEQRIEMCEWLGTTIHRPPLSGGGPLWGPIRALLEALWWDLSDRTPDPLSPVIDGVGMVPEIHPRLIEHHPWQPDEDT